MSIAAEPHVEQPPLDSLYEIVDGRRVEKPPMGADSVWVASVLVRVLANFAFDHELGRVPSEMLFDLGADRPWRRPDLAYVSYERWPRGRRIPRGDAWAVVPDLAIEVISPTNTAGETQRRVREYFEAGVRRVWVVYPDERLVQVYDSIRSVRIVGPGDLLDGEEILPGLQLPVDQLFEDVAGPDE